MLAELLRVLIETVKVSGKRDLLPPHRLDVMNDRSQFDGATPERVHKHFNTWVVEQLNGIGGSRLCRTRRSLKFRRSDLGPIMFYPLRVCGIASAFSSMIYFLESISYHPAVAKLVDTS